MRTIVVTLSLLMCLGSAVLGDDDPGVLYSDDFSTLDPSWGDPDDQFYVQDGKLIIKSKSGSLNALYQGSTFDDVDVRVKITLVDGKDDQPAGIIFWGIDLKNRYEVLLAADGSYSVVRADRDKYMNPVPWRTSDAIKKGVNQVNEVRVVTKGRTATVYINDKQLVTFKGFPPDNGSKIGFHAESGDTPYTWSFDDLVVRKAQ